MKTTFKVTGFREIERVLMNLPKATAKASVRRVLKKAGLPIAEAGAANAPEDSGDLKDSYGVGTRLTKRQRKMNRKDSEVEVYVGPGEKGAVQGVQSEFGNAHQAARPHLRPAWDSQKLNALKIVREEMWADVQRTVARYRKRQAKIGRK